MLSGAVVGGFAGYNKQPDRIVDGVETILSGASHQTSQPVPASRYALHYRVVPAGTVHLVQSCRLIGYYPIAVLARLLVRPEPREMPTIITQLVSRQPSCILELLPAGVSKLHWAS